MPYNKPFVLFPIFGYKKNPIKNTGVIKFFFLNKKFKITHKRGFLAPPFFFKII